MCFDRSFCGCFAKARGPERIWPGGLSVARAMGDSHMKDAGVLISNPDIYEVCRVYFFCIVRIDIFSTFLRGSCESYGSNRLSRQQYFLFFVADTDAPNGLFDNRLRRSI